MCFASVIFFVIPVMRPDRRREARMRKKSEHEGSHEPRLRQQAPVDQMIAPLASLWARTPFWATPEKREAYLQKVPDIASSRLAQRDGNTQFAEVRAVAASFVLSAMMVTGLDENAWSTLNEMSLSVGVPTKDRACGVEPTTSTVTPLAA